MLMVKNEREVVQTNTEIKESQFLQCTTLRSISESNFGNQKFYVKSGFKFSLKNF